MRRLPACCVVLALLGGALARPVAAAEAVHYRPPVDAPVVDRFRPPSSPYGAGNRGIDYATDPGQEVRAAADGEVAFAGQVGGRLHVVVRHADGVRTSYSFLASVAVGRGDRVAAGDVVGRAGGPFHLGARLGEVYLDPLALLTGPAPQLRLVPLEDRVPLGEAEERSRLARFLAGVRRIGAVGAEALQWARAGADLAGRQLADRVALRTWLALARDVAAPVSARLVAAARAWLDQRDDCTPASTPPPPPSGRRLAVLVAGLGSAGPDHGAAFEVDTDGLGYAHDDVIRFSYRGGDARLRPYTAADTQTDLAVPAAHLRALVAQVAARHPGVPIDVIAHSQGGLVARAALTADADRPLPVATLVTLATPHQGASLATAGRRVRATGAGAAVLAAAGRLGLHAIDPTSTSVTQLAEGSAFLDELARRPLPAATRVVSVAARNDLVVPSVACLLPGATNVTVTLDGVRVDDHDELPSSAAARRELALAVAGLPATCRSLADALVDAVVGIGVDATTDLAGIALSGALR